MTIPFSPTRRLAAAVLLTSLLWLSPHNWLGLSPAVYVLTLLALGCLIDVTLMPGRRSLIVERLAPGAVGVTDPAPVVYRLLSRWPVKVRGTLYDALPRALTRREPDPLPFVLAPRTEATLPVTFVGRERGEFPLGPVVVRLQGPLDLIARTSRYKLTDRITVIPSVAALRRFELRSLPMRLREVGLRVLRRRGEGTAFAGLRDYAIGDDPRHIDWKATAHRRRLVSREYSLEQGQTVMILIDAGRLMTQLAGSLPRFEYALSAALVLANVVTRAGDHAGLLVFDDEVRSYIPPTRGTAALRLIRDALVPIQPTMVEPDYAAAFRTLSERLSRRSLLVLFTDVIDVRSSRSLLALTTRGARVHLPVVVALRNEALVAAAVPGGATTTDSLYESAAAEELLSARDEALERMRQAGVSVLDVKPQAMTAAVINRYLEIKGRGQL
ncbi:MAG TPA: DUF58 domain-containing protein [Gemmatimonadaceae bacterium]|nr:DUF58 domain-containing protein [Gemmatimonadaceae bacterium]